MKVYHSLTEIPKLKNSVVTVGTYDGVHLGHRKIIERLTKSASGPGRESVILTFFPHPRMVLYPDDNELKLLNTLHEKIALLETCGVNHLVIHPFTKDFSRLSANEFIRDVLVKLFGMKKIVIGYNHQFGRNREGTFEQLTEMAPLHHFEVEEIPEQDVNHIAVSSTKIREALIRGDILKANELLGYGYSLSGKVIRGEGMGKKLGFPTANISIEENYKLIPAEGIYAVKISYEKTIFNGLLYIGKRPSLNGKSLSIEANIFDFDKEIYNEIIRVSFVSKIRDDMNFQSLDLLTAQMLKDKTEAVKIFSQK